MGVRCGRASVEEDALLSTADSELASGTGLALPLFVAKLVLGAATMFGLLFVMLGKDTSAFVVVFVFIVLRGGHLTIFVLSGN